MPDPAGWLASAIDVSFPDDCEILRVSLRGSNPTELRDLVNAVTDAYLKEVVDRDRMKRLDRVSRLEQVRNEIEQKSRTKREQLRKLSETLGIGDASVLRFKQKLALEELAALRKELRQVKPELIKARVRHKSVQKLTSGAEESPIDELGVTEQVESSRVVKVQHDRVEKLKEHIAELSAADKDSPALKSLLDHLALAMPTLEESRSQVRSAVVERMQRKAKDEATIQVATSPIRLA